VAGIGTAASYALGARGDTAALVAVIPGIALFLLSRAVLLIPDPSPAEMEEFRAYQKKMPIPISVAAGIAGLCVIVLMTSAVSAGFYEITGLHFAAVPAFRLALLALYSVIILEVGILIGSFSPYAGINVAMLKPMFACVIISIFALPTVIANHTTHALIHHRAS